MAPSPLLLAASALLTFLLCSLVAGRDLVGEDRSFRVEAALTRSSPTSSASQATSTGKYLPVVRRHGVRSSSAGGGGRLDLVERLARDRLRVASLQTKIRVASAASSSVRGDRRHVNDQLSDQVISIPATSGEEIGSGDYVVTVGIGTPAEQQTVVFDTGSNVCWIQCQPCVGTCYKQKQPVFDPSSSTSYSNLSCDSAACRGLDASGCSAGTCLYSVRYGDGSSTVGFLATETLSLSPDNVFGDFVFGCGEQNQGLFSGVAGLLGLARSPSSLVSQLSNTLGEVFSYCLPVGDSTTAGYLSIGAGVNKPTTNVAYTPMLSDTSSPSLYFIDLAGISVGGSKLPVAPSVFRSGGTIIDSGTVLTRLPSPAYTALRSAFREAMSQYRLSDPVSLLDTCYDFGGVQNVSYPAITLHYDGADVALDHSSGVLIPVEGSVSCLAFASNGDPSEVSIIGNVQQLGMEVIYDIGQQRIGFGVPGDCS